MDTSDWYQQINVEITSDGCFSSPEWLPYNKCRGNNKTETAIFKEWSAQTYLGNQKDGYLLK